jgi:hypothetical protein
MRNATIGVLSVLGLAYAAFALPTVLQFYSYCRRVAKATGQTKENQNIWTTDEGGINAFQREQLRKLRNGEYMELDDPALVVQGRALARKFRLAWWLAIGLVAAVVCTEFWLQ